MIVVTTGKDGAVTGGPAIMFLLGNLSSSASNI